MPGTPAGIGAAPAGPRQRRSGRAPQPTPASLASSAVQPAASPTLAGRLPSPLPGARPSAAVRRRRPALGPGELATAVLVVRPPPGAPLRAPCCGRHRRGSAPPGPAPRSASAGCSRGQPRLRHRMRENWATPGSGRGRPRPPRPPPRSLGALRVLEAPDLQAAPDQHRFSLVHAHGDVVGQRAPAGWTVTNEVGPSPHSPVSWSRRRAVQATRSVSGRVSPVRPSLNLGSVAT